MEVIVLSNSLGEQVRDHIADAFNCIIVETQKYQEQPIEGLRNQLQKDIESLAKYVLQFGRVRQSKRFESLLGLQNYTPSMRGWQLRGIFFEVYLAGILTHLLKFKIRANPKIPDYPRHVILGTEPTKRRSSLEADLSFDEPVILQNVYLECKTQLSSPDDTKKYNKIIEFCKSHDLEYHVIIFDQDYSGHAKPESKGRSRELQTEVEIFWNRLGANVWAVFAEEEKDADLISFLQYLKKR